MIHPVQITGTQRQEYLYKDRLVTGCIYSIDVEDIESLVGGVNHKVECSTTNIAGAYITK